MCSAILKDLEPRKSDDVRTIDNALTGHVGALRTFWTQLYSLRRITLYDAMRVVPSQLAPPSVLE